MEYIMQIWNLVFPLLDTCFEVLLIMLQAGFSLLGDLGAAVATVAAPVLQDLGAALSKASDALWSVQIKSFDYFMGMLYKHFGVYLQTLGKAPNGSNMYPFKFCNWFIYTGIWLMISRYLHKGAKFLLFAVLYSLAGYTAIFFVALPVIIIAVLSGSNSGTGYSGGYTQSSSYTQGNNDSMSKYIYAAMVAEEQAQRSRQDEFNRQAEQHRLEEQRRAEEQRHMEEQRRAEEMRRWQAEQERIQREWQNRQNGGWY